MRKLHWIVIMSLVLVLCLPIAALAAELCFNAGGSGVHLWLTKVGSGPGIDVYSVDGYVYPDIPVVGTGLKMGSRVDINFGLVKAEASRYSVVWDFNLTAPGLNGTGYYRWYDSSAAGSIGTVTRVSCTFAEEAASEDLTAVGDE